MYALIIRMQDLNFQKRKKLNKTLQDLLEPEVNDKYFLSDRILPTILSDGTGGYKAKSEIDLKIARPLCATMAKMHRACQDNYVTQNGRVRRLTRVSVQDCRDLRFICNPGI